MNLLHAHHWTIPQDRFQACSKCGIVRAVECPHKWIREGSIEARQYGVAIGHYAVLTCEHCGEIKTVKIIAV